LNPSDQIILDPADSIAEGQPVRVVTHGANAQ
jgi:hypothetical protein